MSNTTNNGDDGSLMWTIFKVLAFAIGAIVLLGWLFNIFWALLPFIAVAAVLYLGYKIFLADDSASNTVESQEPTLLEYEEAESVLDEEDELEKKFEELETRESQRS